MTPAPERTPTWTRGVAAAGGGALLGSLFAPWCTAPGPLAHRVGDGRFVILFGALDRFPVDSGWQALSLGLVVVLAAAGAAATVVFTASARLRLVAALMGAGAAVVIGGRIAEALSDGLPRAVRWGAWVALAAALVITAGAGAAARSDLRRPYHRRR